MNKMMYVKFLFACVIIVVIQNANGRICKQRGQPPVWRRQFASSSTKSVSDGSDQKQSVSRGIIKLALSLNYILSRKAGENENVMFAPVNIVKTLALVMLGAVGETEKEIADLLGVAFGRNDTKKLHESIGSVIAQITTEHPGTDIGVNLQISGGVFVQSDLVIRELYKTLAKSIYNSNVIEVDFAKDGYSAANTINQWVSNQTLGRITDLIQPPVDQSTKAIFAGALYFNGDWEQPFLAEATRWQKFFLGSEGKSSKNFCEAELMVNQGTYKYYTNGDYQAIGIPYKGQDIYMFAVLPKLNYDLKNLTMSLTGESDIHNIVHNSKNSDALVIFPKMKVHHSFDLKNPLQELGIERLFNSSAADLSNLAEGIYASEVIHQAEVDINEIGTTASAATVVTISRGGYVTVRFDRPFLFFIYNVKTDTLTFWGSIYKPTPCK